MGENGHVTEVITLMQGECHVTEIVSLMEGEWSCYSLNEGEWSCYSLNEGEWSCYRGGLMEGVVMVEENGHVTEVIKEGIMVILQRWPV